MPNFTVELRSLVQRHTEPEKAWAAVGLDEYVIFDEAYRPTLNRNIIDNFYMREIGFETPELFRFHMQRRMRLIMPVYNDLFESTRLEFDPLLTVNLTTMAREKTEGETLTEGQSSQESDTESKSRSVDQQTPQTALKGNADYASGAADVSGTTKGSGNSTENARANAKNDSESESTTKGYQGSPATRIAEYRATLINVDRMILTELDNLFMQVWDSGDRYTETMGGYYV